MRSERRITPRTLAVLTGLLIGAAAAVLAAGQPVTEEQLPEKIETARTAADHEALAAFYRDQARETEAKAAEHEEMAAKYAGLTGKGDWATHCRNLVSYYRKLATEYLDLAKLHEAEAAKLGGK